MSKHLVLTLSGPDRVGMVEEITNLVLKHSGNVEESRMARLGGEFAMLMLINVKAEAGESLEEALNALQNDNYKVTLKYTDTTASQKYNGWMPYKILINGADHEGIVHKIAHHLADKNVNIESMETHIRQAPMSGAPLFIMEGIILVPPEQKTVWREELSAAAEELNVDIEISTYIG